MTQHPVDFGLAARAASLDVGSLFRFRAHYHGDRIALRDDTRTYRYAELNARVNRLANALTAAGIRPGDRVGILSENRSEYIEAQLAAAKLGAILAAQNWRLARAELEHCITLVEPHAMLVSPRFRDQLQALSHGARHVVCFGEQYEALLAGAPATEPQDVAAPEDGLVILYTSGTTGLPKGALISHRAMIARGDVYYRDWPLDSEDGFVAWAPLFHMASTDMALAVLMQGGTVTVVDGFDAARLAQVVAHERIGWLVLLPGAITPVIEALREIGAPPVGVKVAGAMADLVPLQELAEVTALLQAPYVNTFGSTETGIPPASNAMLAVGEVPHSLSKRQNSGCRVRLVDTQDNEVPDGEAGELSIRGPTLFSGYWNAPETNARDFRGGWFHMGDVFVRNADGTLDFVDRRKYLIKSGGENIYPAEIERLLLADARIAEAVVVRKSDPHWGEVPVAFVVPRATATAEAGLTPADVVACYDGKLARYKHPREIRFVEDADLPRSTTGKIRRHELEAALHKQPAN